MPGGEDQKSDTLLPIEETISSEQGDLRVSWIYKLRKDQLDSELGKFRLDLSGTVEEKKRRLVKFIREGCASPQPRTAPPVFHMPPPTLEIPPTAQTYAEVATGVAAPGFTVSSVCEKVRKWNLHFNGRTDAVEFLEKLSEFQEHSEIPSSLLLQALYEIFQGNALAWYRNNKNLWNKWEDFLTDFKCFYLPAHYQANLEEQIYNRRQLPGESGRDYVVALQTLFRRHGEFSAEKAMHRLYGNLRPEYRQYIRQSEVKSTQDLVCKIEEFEALQRELITSRPSTSSSRPPATPPAANRVRVISEQPTLGTEPEPSRNTTSNTNSYGLCTTARTGTDASSGTTQRNRTPVNRAPAPRTNANLDAIVCWRCGRTGHYRSQCRNPPKLFCSRCGRNGILTRDCGCTNPPRQTNQGSSGNGSGTVLSRGQASSAPAQPREN